MPAISYREALNQALVEEMERDESILTFGEDVAFIDGTYKVTKGLMKAFGESRVFDTPISEAAIIGMSTGMALGGLRPIPELMTVNFSYVAMDQIMNHLAVMRYMFGGQVKLPVTIRMPGGGGHQLGSQHSHSVEAYFVHTPGLKVVYPAFPADAKGLLKASIQDDSPVVFLEHHSLYNLKGEVPDDLEPVPIGRANIVREGDAITIVGYGRMTHVALEAADLLAQEDLHAEVIDMRSLRPWDKETVVNSVAKTHHAVIVEECPPVCGIGAEVAAGICELAFDDLDAPVGRVSGSDTPLPYARELEQTCIPQPRNVVQAVKKSLEHD